MAARRRRPGAQVAEAPRRGVRGGGEAAEAVRPPERAARARRLRARGTPGTEAAVVTLCATLLHPLFFITTTFRMLSSAQECCHSDTASQVIVTELCERLSLLELARAPDAVQVLRGARLLWIK